MMPLAQGRFIAVVGPSGAGKDALLTAARTALADAPRFVFARRVVTRARSAAEDHDSMTETEFAAVAAQGGFLLHWSAHGLRYGLPIALADDLAQGRLVIANISRSSIGDAETICGDVVVLNITASPDTRATRMALRGRESKEAILARIARDAPLHADKAHVIDIPNDGTLADAAGLFIATLRSL